MHTLTLTFNDTQALLDFVTKHLTSTAAAPLAGVSTMGLVDSNNPPVEAKPTKKTKVKIDETPKQATADLSASDEKDEPKAPPTPEDKPIEYVKDVRPFATKLFRMEGGKPKVMALLAKYGVSNAEDLGADKLPKFLADIKAELGE